MSFSTRRSPFANVNIVTISIDSGHHFVVFAFRPYYALLCKTFPRTWRYPRLVHIVSHDQEEHFSVSFCQAVHVHLLPVGALQYVERAQQVLQSELEVSGTVERVPDQWKVVACGTIGVQIVKYLVFIARSEHEATKIATRLCHTRLCV